MALLKNRKIQVKPSKLSRDFSNGAVNRHERVRRMEEQWENHLTAEQMDKYINNALTSDEAYAVEYHLGDCRECVNEMRVLRRFNYYWRKWTTGEYADSSTRSRIIHALRRVAEQSPALRNRVEKWLDTSFGVGGAVRILFKGVGEATRIITNGLEDITMQEARWLFTSAAEPAFYRGISAPSENSV